jgi:hypothetical protein
MMEEKYEKSRKIVSKFLLCLWIILVSMAYYFCQDGFKQLAFIISAAILIIHTETGMFGIGTQPTKVGELFERESKRQTSELSTSIIQYYQNSSRRGSHLFPLCLAREDLNTGRTQLILEIPSIKTKMDGWKFFSRYFQGGTCGTIVDSFSFKLSQILFEKILQLEKLKDWIKLMESHPLYGKQFEIWTFWKEQEKYYTGIGVE